MEIRRTLALARKWAWLILLGALVTGGVAYGISSNNPPTYRASALLLIDEAPESGRNEYAQALFEERLATTYVELIGLYPVMEETVRRLDLPMSSAQLKGRITIDTPSEAQIIAINVVDTDPERAALIANTIGDVFTDINRERESARFAESIQNYDEQTEALQAEITAIETQIISLAEPETAEGQAQLLQLETGRREAQLRYTEAFNSLEALRVEEARISNNLIPVEPARPPTSAIGPRTMTNTLLGVAVGAILAIGVAFVVEFMDDTVRSPDQVQELVGISTLGAVSHIKGKNAASLLVTFNAPRTPVSEAFRLIRTNLSFAAIDADLRTLTVSSSGPGEGKSTVSANMAVVMAQTGKRVIIVDADLRRPTQHKLFALPNNQGLTTALLNNDVPFARQLQQTKVPNLWVLTSGPIPPNPAELLNSQRMSLLIEALQEEADLVVFDTPPCLTVADAIILAPQTTGCALVIDAGKTRQQALVQAVERLQNSGAQILGAVLNQVKITRSDYYYHEYQRYYDYSSIKSSNRRDRGGDHDRGHIRARWPNWLSPGKRP